MPGISAAQLYLLSFIAASSMNPRRSLNTSPVMG